VLDAVKDEDSNVLDRFDESDYGKSGWVIDPEGTRSSCGSRLLEDRAFEW